MESGALTLGLMVLLAGLMITAAISDLRRRTISNRLNAAIAVLAVPFWIVGGWSFWPDVPLQFAAALAVFLIFAGLFAIGPMGGCDVKIIGAVMIMAIGGGILSVVMLVKSKIRPSDKAIEVPYGVAIAAAGLWALHQQYLNQFQFIASS